MADLTYTAANIRPLDGSVSRQYPVGGTVAPGDLVYLAATGKVLRADADVTHLTARAIGVVTALNQGKATGADGDVATVTIFGPVAGFTDLTPGANGFVSDEAGKIADAEATRTRVVGYAESATVFFVSIEVNDPSS